MIQSLASFLSRSLCQRGLIAAAVIMAGFVSLATPHHFTGKPCHAQQTHQDGGSGHDHSTAPADDGTCLIHCVGTAILLRMPQMDVAPPWRGIAVPPQHSVITRLHRLDRPPKLLS